LLDTVGLSGFGRRKPHELSGGERQRVALARTLAVEPAVILFDEPLSSLDAALRKRLRSDLVDEQRRLGFTAVYVTHDLEEAMAMGDALAVMDGGRVLQCAPPRELWEAPAGVAVARFMGSGPCLPVLRFERKGGRFLARTAAGLFSLPGVDAANAGEAGNAAGIGSGGSAGQSYVFFGRSEASRVSDGAGSGESVNSFDALCLRADFAGDAVDCLMETGGERCILRFARDGAPEAGERARFGVPEARVRLIR
jgi:iron(III) transport system ATP-binding protein